MHQHSNSKMLSAKRKYKRPPPLKLPPLDNHTVQLHHLSLQPSESTLFQSHQLADASNQLIRGVDTKEYLDVDRWHELEALDVDLECGLISQEEHDTQMVRLGAVNRDLDATRKLPSILLCKAPLPTLQPSGPKEVGPGLVRPGDVVHVKAVEEVDDRPCLPGSPAWTKKMNPGRQPDGSLTYAKCSIMRTKLEVLVHEGDDGTELVREVDCKRARHATRIAKTMPVAGSGEAGEVFASLVPAWA